MSINKKFEYYVDRKFTLLEQDLVAQALVRAEGISGFYYNELVYISKKGVCSIYLMSKDVKRLKNCIEQKGSQFINEQLAHGFSLMKKMKIMADKLTSCTSKTELPKIRNLLENAIRLYNKFGSFLEFTHRISFSGIKFGKIQLTELGIFHDTRKISFFEFVRGISHITELVAEKKNLEIKNLDFFTVSEIKDIIDKLNPDVAEIKRLDVLRRRGYYYHVTKKSLEIKMENLDRIQQRFALLARKDNKKSNKIVGECACNGKTAGIVQVVFQDTPIDDIQKNRVIATTMTTPFQTPVLQQSKAIVTNEGGILSHAANIAREFKIPCIVGTRIATKVLKDGDMVEVDADNGIVKIIKS